MEASMAPIRHPGNPVTSPAALAFGSVAFVLLVALVIAVEAVGHHLGPWLQAVLR
jgi:hypothetical protein